MSASPSIIETERLHLCHLRLDDAPFVLELLNDAEYVRFIGDKGVRTVEDACEYLRTGPIASYAQHGFGLYAMRLAGRDTAIGMCGLIKRDTLPDVDIGYALLSAHRGHGYAFEAAAAVLAHGRDTLGLTRIVAVTARDNLRSIHLLEKLGLQFEQTITWPDDGAEVNLFAVG